MQSFDEIPEVIFGIFENDSTEDDTQSSKLSEFLSYSKEQGAIMEHLINNQIKVKDDLIDKLHKELDYYKQDLADRFVNQLMKAVIKVRKDMIRLMSSANWESMSTEELRREYIYSFENVTDLLEQQNVDSYSSKPGDDFDALIHQARVEATNDINLDKKIKESISEGYKKGEKVLQPERVIVYQYKG